MRQLQDFSKAQETRPDMDVLPEECRQQVSDAFDTWDGLRSRNQTLTTYYRMHNRMKDLGISIPPQLVHVNSVVGWADKAIRVMAVRSRFDGYSIGGGTLAELDALARENGLASLYQNACRSSLVHGVSAMTVMKGNAWQPKAKVRSFSASQCVMLWDKDEGRIACGVVLQDVDPAGRPLKYVAHFPDRVLTIWRPDAEADWQCIDEPNPQGTPLMVAFPYDPDDDRPLGHSRITPEVMGIIDKAMRDVLRMEVGSEYFTAPQRYILGAPPELFTSQDKRDAAESAADASSSDGELSDDDAAEPAPKRPTREDYMKAYIGQYLAITRDANGDIPSVGQFPAVDSENFIRVFENDAQRFSGATNVPLGQLGVLSNTYTSSDALGAANDPLILEVQEMNRRNREPMEQVGRLILAISRGTTISELDPQEQAMSARFEDPSMQTFAAKVDGWTKISAADQSIAGTRVWYEGMGLPKATVDRIMASKDANAATMAYQQIFGQGRSASQLPDLEGGSE